MDMPSEVNEKVPEGVPRVRNRMVGPVFGATTDADSCEYYDQVARMRSNDAEMQKMMQLRWLYSESCAAPAGPG